MLTSPRGAVTSPPQAGDDDLREYLGYQEIAERLGIDAATVRSYRRFGYLPEPDAMIGDRPGWTSQSIDRWQADRPGRGARTDLQPRRRRRKPARNAPDATEPPERPDTRTGRGTPGSDRHGGGTP